MRRRKNARNDSRRQFKSAADRRVITFRDQVDLTILEMPIGTDARIAREEFGQQRHDIVEAHTETHADLEHPRRSAAISRDIGDGRLHAFEIACDILQKLFARFGQRELARRAVKEPDAEIALQHRDIAADGRGSEAKPARSR